MRCHDAKGGDVEYARCKSTVGGRVWTAEEESTPRKGGDRGVTPCQGEVDCRPVQVADSVYE